MKNIMIVKIGDQSKNAEEQKDAKDNMTNKVKNLLTRRNKQIFEVHLQYCKLSEKEEKGQEEKEKKKEEQEQKKDEEEEEEDEEGGKGVERGGAEGEGEGRERRAEKGRMVKEEKDRKEVNEN